MEWFVFLLITILWLFLFYLVRENTSFFRLFPFAIITLVFGVLLSTGVNFPSGVSAIVSGATTTQTITYTTYNASLSTGSTNVPLLWAAQWSLIGFGIVSMLYAFVLSYRALFQPTKETL